MIAEIGTLLLKIFDVLTTGKAQNRQALLDALVTPSFHAVTTMHREYQHTFPALQNIVMHHLWPSQDMVDWIEKWKREFDSVRSDLRYFAYIAANFDTVVLKTSEFFGTIVPDTTNTDQAYYLAIAYYLRDVIAYISEIGSPTERSWYLDFIHIIKNPQMRPGMACESNHPENEGGCFPPTIDNEMHVYIKDILTITLLDTYESICRNYHIIAANSIIDNEK